MDAGRKEVDAKLASLENRIDKEYKQATREMKKKLETYMNKMKVNDRKMKADYKAGKITLSDYLEWYSNATLRSQYYQDMLSSLTADLVNADKMAVNLINGFLPEVYADSFNYETYFVENQTRLNTAFTLYNRETVSFLLQRKNNKAYSNLLPKASVDIPKDQKWNKSKVASAMTQGILQGESIPQIAKRLQGVADMDRGAAVRNARTMTTYAESQGRLGAMQRAKSMGISIMKEWQSTLDGRTRHSHRLLDGERQDLEDKFSNGLMEPSDPDGDPSEVYNCRCGIVAWFKDIDSDIKQLEVERENKLAGMTYDEWKYEHQSIDSLQKSINEQHSKMIALENKAWSGLWIDDRTVKDYESLRDSGAIERKRDYFKKKLKADPKNADIYRMRLKQLDDLEASGEQYLYLSSREASFKIQLNKKKAQKALGNKGQKTTNGYRVITQAERDAGWTFTTAREADDMLRPWCGSEWSQMPYEERRALYDYTSGSGPFNRPLRGYDGGWGEWNNKGIGKVDLDAEWKADGIKHAEEALAKSKTPHGMWLYRGVSMEGTAGFLGVDSSWLYGASESDVQVLVGKLCTDTAFMSCGSAEGTGFGGDVVYKIFLPEGSQALYVEPFSHYSGGGHMFNWDGKSPQSYIGSECETLLQCGGTYQIRKISKSGWRLEIEMDVVSQEGMAMWRRMGGA